MCRFVRRRFSMILAIGMAATLSARAERAEADGYFWDPNEPIDEAPMDEILPDLSGATLDCDRNGVDDQKEYDEGTAKDSDDDGLLDKCELVPGDADLDRDVDEADGLIVSRAIDSVEGVDRQFTHGADVNQDHVVDSVDVTIWGRYYHDATGLRFECSDAIDNDGDGKTDFPADPGCPSAVGRDERAAPTPKPQCSDRTDNDGDGTADFAATGPGTSSTDPDCKDADDNREASGE